VLSTKIFHQKFSFFNTCYMRRFLHKNLTIKFSGGNGLNPVLFSFLFQSHVRVKFYLYSGIFLKDLDTAIADSIPLGNLLMPSTVFYIDLLFWLTVLVYSVICFSLRCCSVTIFYPLLLSYFSNALLLSFIGAKLIWVAEGN